MHRIDSSTATPDNRFTEGNPVIPIPATTVTADWLNSVQEELCAIVAAAGIELDKTQHAQVLAAIRALIAEKTPGIATTETNGLVHPDGVTINIDAGGKISLAVQPAMDPVGGIRFFEDRMPRPGYVPCNATVISNFSGRYPEMAAYLLTEWGAQRLVTLSEYEAMHVATWATLADGTKIGWQGIGGVTKMVWDRGADTLKLPDLQDMTRFAASASIDVGGVGGDVARRVIGWLWPTGTGAYAGGVCYPRRGVYGAGYGSHASDEGTGIDTARVVPTGPANAPRRWGALACVYLGQPAS